AFWGGALAHAKVLTDRAQRFIVIVLGVLVAAGVHGLFDAIVFSTDHELTLGQARAAQIILVAACFAFLRWRMRVALSQSPFRVARAKAGGGWGAGGGGQGAGVRGRGSGVGGRRTDHDGSTRICPMPPDPRPLPPDPCPPTPAPRPLTPAP